MNRRGFVVSSVVLGATAITAYVAGNRYWAGREENVEFQGTTDQDRLLSIFRDPESAATVGRRFVTLHPEHASTVLLLDKLKTRIVPEGVPLAELAPREIVARTSRRIRTDFMEERVVDIDGWVLSHTEVLLCALAALEGPERLGPDLV